MILSFYGYFFKYSDFIEITITFLCGQYVRATPKIDIYTYFGSLGACCENGNWSPRIGISSQQAAVGIVYRFL
ncbi:MAG: hypothetical protein MJZ09_09550 [Bacteroidales bacterium]|nr:hypothetical protein [Bacteroidales bacterium]